MEGKFEFPDWLGLLPRSEQPRARAKFIVRYAALLATPEGTMDALSLAMGYGAATVQSALGGGRYDEQFPVTFVTRLESVIGYGAIPREAMNAGVFGIKSAGNSEA